MRQIQRRATRRIAGLMRIATLALLALGCSRSASPGADTMQPAAPAPGDSARSIAAIADRLPAATSCFVTDSSIGPVRLGMTLAEARQAMPGATFARSHDGEGIAAVVLIVGSDSLMSLTANDDEADEIDWTKRITFMETFSRSCRTADGVHPGALVVDVERLRGRVTKIIMSEIESRQYVEFERQPDGLIFRLDYTGIFPDGTRETLRFEPGARIFSIAIPTPS